MDAILPFTPSPSEIQVKHGDKFLLLGSCFADSMTEHFSSAGFETLSNPFGTIFHPMALAEVLEATIQSSDEVNVFQREDLYFSWDCSSKIYGMSEQELINNTISTRERCHTFLKSTKLLVITFGTSYGYVHSNLNKVVANCHKANSSTFRKELTGVEQMISRWKETLKKLKEFNPSLSIVFSVSPVRHAKDGLVENNRSKARLIELVHALSNQDQVDYFPAYELIIDQLRDYRYFKRDLVHPSGVAVSHVWELFQASYFTKETSMLGNEVNRINKSLTHKYLHAESQASSEHAKTTMQTKSDLQNSHPEIYWK